MRSPCNQAAKANIAGAPVFSTWTPLMAAAAPEPLAAAPALGFWAPFAFNAAFFWRSFSCRSFSTCGTASE